MERLEGDHNSANERILRWLRTLPFLQQTALCCHTPCLDLDFSQIVDSSSRFPKRLCSQNRMERTEHADYNSSTPLNLISQQELADPSIAAPMASIKPIITVTATEVSTTTDLITTHATSTDTSTTTSSTNPTSSHSSTASHQHKTIASPPDPATASDWDPTTRDIGFPTETPSFRPSDTNGPIPVTYSSSNAATVAASVLGVIMALAIIATVAVCLMWRKKKKRNQSRGRSNGSSSGSPTRGQGNSEGEAYEMGRPRAENLNAA